MLSNVIILQITYYHLFMLSYKISACLLRSQYTEPGRQSELDNPFRSSGISLLVWSVDIVFQSIFNGHMRELSTVLAGIWYKGPGLDMSIRNVGCMFSHIFKLKLFSKIFNTRALLWEVVCECALILLLESCPLWFGISIKIIGFERLHFIFNLFLSNDDLCWVLSSFPSSGIIWCNGLLPRQGI